MSRYEHEVERDGKPHQVAYGFDTMLGQYFLVVMNDEGPLLSIGSIMVLVPPPGEGFMDRKESYDNTDMFEMWKTWGVPENHLKMLRLDLPV
jgi:hypothetical protein